MAKKRIKVKEHENLSDANIERVIDLLKESKPITKKSACEILNISYNTSRLQTIMDNHISRKKHEKAQRDKNRGKPATTYEIESTIKLYLEGAPISDIAKQLYRSPSFINAIIERLGVPKKETGDDKYLVGILPDQCVAQEFKPGQVVWSSKYHSPCEVISEAEDTFYEEKYGCKVYKIYVIEALDEVNCDFPRVTVGGFHASSLAYDLGSLEHLAQYDTKYSS
jgi:hypothetical protein